MESRADDPAESADSAFADLSLEELMAVDVSTASYVLASRQKQPVSMTTISREQIVLSGARTLLELLTSYVPGFFHVEDQDDVIAAFRGYSPDNNSKVLLLVDGRPFNTEWFGGPSDAILNLLDLELVDHVEVIRGPGSVTLGPGALLGVINVVTRTAGGGEGTVVTASAGPYGDRRTSLVARFDEPGGVRGRMFLSWAAFTGQKPDPRGWQVLQQNPPGLTVFDRNHHLHAGEQLIVRSQLERGDLALDLLLVDSARDNAQFYRDRETIAQRQLATALWWRPSFGVWRLSVGGFFDRDDFGARSHEGAVMAGVREERAGVVASVVGKDWWSANTLAAGLELELYRLGLPDHDGANFIINDAQKRGSADNVRNTYVDRDTFGTVGLFIEDTHDLPGDVDVFAGLRLDVHPRWGTALSPRLGAIWTPIPALKLRLSLQSGFRGAPGVHYTGGFRGDGLLGADNFDAVGQNPFARAAGFDDLTQTRPERLYALEVGAHWHPFDTTKIEAVAFVDWMDHVIDVGVIYLGDDQAFVAASEAERTIGDDRAGDWNGWFYFKNNPGTLVSAGGEISASTRVGPLELSGSGAVARLVSAPAAQVGSMYVSGSADDPHFKAYPELVGRARATVRPGHGVVASVGLLWFSGWYSPAWQSGGPDGEGAAVVDLAASWARGPIELTGTLRNALDAAPLWPMNSNVADASASPGTPALEHITGWLTVRLRL
jgi:outer membrane receptor protein involved in Fe transport